MLASETKFVVKQMTKYKSKLVLIACTGILTALCKGYLAPFVQKMIAASNDTNKLYSLAWVGLAIAFTMGLSRYLHMFTMNVVSENVSQDLREQLQHKFINLDLKFHSKYVSGSGGLMSRTFNDVKFIHDGLRLFADLFSAPLTFIFIFIALIRLDWRLTTYILVAVPILAFVLGRLSRSVRKYSLLGVEQLENVTSTVKESLDGVRTIQSFSLQKLLSKKLMDQGRNYLDMRTKNHARIEAMGPFTEFLATIIVLTIIFYFSSKISKGQTDTSYLVGYITAMLQINEPIKKFQEAYVRMQETRVSAKRIQAMVEEKSAIDEPSNPVAFPENWNEIIYKDVFFSYSEEQKLLNHFNLTIKKGQTVAFVGESGSGKSTVANLLARFYDPDQGEIFIGGNNIKSFAVNDLRNQIALVSQDVFLFSDTIERNIQAGVEFYDFDRIRSCAKAASAHDFIMKMPLQYASFVGERGNMLSGGEKQRVAIARAFYKDSPILILDEATSALDSVSEEQVQKGLDQLMKGRTTLVIAHRLSTVIKADMIVVMKKGQVVESGSHQELIDRKSEYYKLFETQNFKG